jgi:hypothetical protein
MLISKLPSLAGRLKQFANDAGLAGANVRYIVRDQEMVPASTGLRLRDLAVGRPVTVDLPFAAQRIWLKNNVRIDGIERLPGTTAKLQIRKRGLRPSVLRDVRARAIGSHLIAGPMIGIPKIRAYDKRTAGWYIEDYVDGRISTRADLVEFVIHHGAALWLPAPRLRRIKRPFQRALIDALERSLASIFPPVSEDALWPVTFGHNDLRLDNLLRDRDGKFWLIDWEGAGEVPVVSDLGSAYLDAPELADAMMGILATADPSGRALSPRHQLALGASLALQRRATGAATEARWRGFSEQEAMRRQAEIVNLYRGAIVELAG